MKIQIAHLYPELLNLYGDRGNIASLKYRTMKRGIDCELVEVAPGDSIDFENTDIIFIGGGSDKDQLTVCKEITQHRDKFISYVENGGVLLAVCGGFELVGKYYKINGETIDALGIADFYTEHDKDRHIGNIVIHSDMLNSDIVGFENHSGRVYANGLTPLGSVVKGFGNCNNGFEGVVYKNMLATYLHGPLLPKNPVLCDYIISKALQKKYGECNLPELDDTLENSAHAYAVGRFSK